MVMNLSKCIKIFFSLFLCFLLFTGCTGSRHLKDLFIVEGLGIDYYDNNLSVTLQGLKVNVSNASDTPLGNMVVNTSASGTTVSYAINNIAKAVSKRAFFGHNKIIVLSKELAQNDIKNYIDYFLRSEDSRADVAICVSKEKAKFILESKENDANVPSENILFLINNNEETGQSILVNENEFLMLYEDKCSDIYLPVIERKDDESTVKSAGIALFSDNRLAYITNDIETKGFVILNNKAKDVLIQISDKKFGKIDVKLSNIKCKKSASIVENKVYFNVEINADIILGEIEKGAQNKLSKKDNKRLCALVEKACNEMISKTYNACIYAKSNALRIGKFIARDCPEYYEKHLSDINGDFQKAELNVNSYINLEKISDNSQLE